MRRTTPSRLEDEMPFRTLEGRVWKFGDGISTDYLMPGFTRGSTDEERASFCMRAIRADFAGSVMRGDGIVGGRNFGCGSARPASTNLVTLGVSCVIAESFGRIFFRNCINIGLPVFESAEAAAAIEQGHVVEADMDSGEVRDLSTGATFRAAGFPPLVQGIISSGGLVEYAREQLSARKAQSETR